MVHPFCLARRHTLWALVVVAACALSGCGSLSSAMPFAQPTPTFTPTPSPTSTPIPSPTPTTAAGATAPAAAATPVPTPVVTIPAGFSGVRDDRLGYSFAVPSGWSDLDLRSSQFQSLAGLFGLGDRLTELNKFLNSPQGQMLGKIYVTDLTSAMFGGLPTLLAVVESDAPGYTPEKAKQLIKQMLKENAGKLGNVQINNLEATTVNNLPAVSGTATVDLSSAGMKGKAFAKVVGLLANDKVYAMVLLAPEDQRAAKEPVFDQIIGTFRPE